MQHFWYLDGIKIPVQPLSVTENETFIGFGHSDNLGMFEWHAKATPNGWEVVVVNRTGRRFSGTWTFALWAAIAATAKSAF